MFTAFPERMGLVDFDCTKNSPPRRHAKNAMQDAVAQVRSLNSKKVVDTRIASTLSARAHARSSDDHLWLCQTRDGKQTPPEPKPVDASSLISTSQSDTGEKPANIEHLRSQLKKNDAKLVIATLHSSLSL